MVENDTIAATITRFAPRGETPKWIRRIILGLRSSLVALLATTVFGLTACEHPPSPASDIGGPFALTDQNGVRVDQDILRGHWSLVFFGYTFCPDVCPTTLTNLSAAIDRLRARANTLQVVFITVDPDRDTPAQLRSYLASPSFPKHVVGLTGSTADIAAAAKAYRVFYQKAGAGPGYSVDHTSIVYLMDPMGRFVRPLAFGQSPTETARQIDNAMNGT